ncbi:AcrR family transcriptional regulator [Lactobacillus colini]|uniref:AcrR family transcriptional regulator n=1 Tax=Lactobacillus colini TaxID=1819254 RepID=A0ABS4MEW9_9LACO|nr:TetR/AcrR family transcriptional regulator [Lactobacillus colini]MBP2058168.1 AcrR family transcriptional regulator [Lactobacillus colini]
MVKSTFNNLSPEKKKRVEQALLDEFSHYPLSKAQVARIVKEAQIARGAFYKYFDDLTDAYNYLYQQVMKEVHLGYRNLLGEYDPDVFYQMTIDFIDQVENSQYRELIKLHLSENESELQSDPKKMSERLLKLDACKWSAMVLTHEVINLVLFDPKNRKQNLNRYRESLELLKGR